MRRASTTALRQAMRVTRPVPRVAFVLSGGGNQGVAQVGMLRALLERDIVPDVVVGTSAGALNGAAVAHDPTVEGVDRLARTWIDLTSADVFPGGKLSRAWNVLRRGTYLFDHTGLQALIQRSTPARTFADLTVPLRVVATDLDSGEEVVLAQGPLEPALLASAALPGVFPIVEHDGRRLVDGGVVNLVPLWHALSGPVGPREGRSRLETGVDRSAHDLVIYVMNVTGGGSDRAPRSPLDVVMTSFAHSRNQRFDLELRYAPPNVEIVVLPRPRDTRDLFDFSGAEVMIDEAHRLAGRTLDEFEARLARRALRRRFRPGA